ncbi:MAG: hypothetical protein AB8I08_19320 [Sandaracinaceae bacterium]
MMLHTAAAWLALAVSLALSLGYLSVGATLARKAQPLAGYLLIAVGALGLMLGCCSVIGRVVPFDSDVRDAVVMVLSLADLAHTLVHGGCLVGAAVQLSKAAQSTGAPAPQSA